MISTIVKPLSAQSVSLFNPVRMRVASPVIAGTLFALVPFQIWEIVFLLSEQAFKRRELAHKSNGLLCFGPESEVAVRDSGFRFSVALVQAKCCSFFSGGPSYLCSSRVGPGVLSELMNLTSLSPGSRIVMPYPGEPDRVFERILGWSVGDGTCWVSIGGDPWFILEDLGNVAGLFDGTGQSDYPRSVVNLEQNHGCTV